MLALHSSILVLVQDSRCPISKWNQIKTYTSNTKDTWACLSISSLLTKLSNASFAVANLWEESKTILRDSSKTCDNWRNLNLTKTNEEKKYTGISYFSCCASISLSDCSPFFNYNQNVNTFEASTVKSRDMRSSKYLFLVHLILFDASFKNISLNLQLTR